MIHSTKVCPKCLLNPLSTDSPKWICPDCGTHWEEEELETEPTYH